MDINPENENLKDSAKKDLVNKDSGYTNIENEEKDTEPSDYFGEESERGFESENFSVGYNAKMAMFMKKQNLTTRMIYLPKR